MAFWIVFIIGQILYAVGSSLDYASSLRQMTHGLTEGMKLNRDRYGYFSPSKFIRNHLIYWGIFTGLSVVGLVAGYPEVLAIFGGMFIIAGGLSLFVAWNNEKKAKASRENQQLPALRALSQIGALDPERIGAALNGLPVVIIGGRGRYVDFPWFYVDGLTEDAEGVKRIHDAVNPNLWHLSQKPESAWFAKTDLQRVG